MEQAVDTQGKDGLMFNFLFGESARPPICTLPNLIFKNLYPAVPSVLDVVQSRGGVWGEMPHFANDGGPFISNRYAGKHDYFYEWGNTYNQDWLRESGAIVRLGMFVMMIDVRTPHSVHEDIGIKLPGHTPLLDDMQDLIVNLIDKLGWAYLQLSDESDLAMFVTSKTNSSLVLDLERLFAAQNLPFTKVSDNGVCCYWNLPNTLSAK